MGRGLGRTGLGAQEGLTYCGRESLPTEVTLEQAPERSETVTGRTEAWGWIMVGRSKCLQEPQLATEEGARGEGRKRK